MLDTAPPGKRGVKPRPVAERFWSKVIQHEIGCWEWAGAKVGVPPKWWYGALQSSGRPHRVLLAHRISWEIHYGPIPDNTEVTHLCDTPSCVRPDHLRLGTHADNMRDMHTKARHAHGERAAYAKLTEADVRRLRELRAMGLSYVKIGKVFGITRSGARQIAIGERWSHVQ